MKQLSESVELQILGLVIKLTRFISLLQSDSLLAFDILDMGSWHFRLPKETYQEALLQHSQLLPEVVRGGLFQYGLQHQTAY